MYRIDRLDVSSDVPDASIEEQLKWCRDNIIRINDASGTTVAGKKWLRIRQKNEFNEARIHTNASGDFTLMAKSAWEQVRGYLELPIFCANLDGLLCLMAIGVGIKQVILEDPMRIYHIDHGLGWITLSLEEQLRFFAQKPWLDHSIINEVSSLIAKGQVPNLFNEEDWGLANEDLPDEVLS